MHRSTVRPWLVMMTMERRRVPGGTARRCRISATIVFRRSSRASVVTINTRRGPGTPPSNHRPARCLVPPLCGGYRPVISAHYNSHVRNVRRDCCRRIMYGRIVLSVDTASRRDISQKQLEALGQCIPPPRHVLPVSRYGSVSGSLIRIATKM